MALFAVNRTGKRYVACTSLIDDQVIHQQNGVVEQCRVTIKINSPGLNFRMAGCVSGQRDERVCAANFALELRHASGVDGKSIGSVNRAGKGNVGAAR